MGRFSGGAGAASRLSVAPGNRVAMLGDSLTGGLTSDPTVATYLLGQTTPLVWAHYSQPGLILGVAAGVSGNNSSEALARITDITGESPRPDYCIVLLGTNDAADAVAAATYAANMERIFDLLRGAGIRPIAVAVPPQPNSTVQPSTTRRLLVSRYNAWLAAFCPREGIPLIDPNPSVMDETNGAWQAQYDSGDGIHPNAVGYRTLGELIGAELDNILPPWTPPFPLHPVAADNANLAANPFMDDSNADGTPNSWVKSGTGTASVVDPGDASILGQALRFQSVDATFTQVTLGFAASVWAAGDRIAFCGRWKCESSAGQAVIAATFTGASPAQNVRPVANHTIASNGWKSFYIEHIVPPAGSTTGGFSVQVQSAAGADIYLAQPAAYNLTALGVD